MKSLVGRKIMSSNWTLRELLNGANSVDDNLVVYLYDKNEETYERLVVVATGNEVSGQKDIFCERLDK